ncbi:MAG TPA: transcription antitermination factor NusB [Bacilli bacterium]|nr:transcription antitermination factor NusB [Bacilli bacterium]
MGKSRSELRKKCMVILYQVELMKKSNISYDLDEIIKNNLDIDSEFVKDIIYGVTTHNDEIEKEINKYLINWSLDRLDKIGGAILKIATYELMYTDTPPIVVINEAINLAKKYSDDSIRKIINASLDRMMKDYE